MQFIDLKAQYQLIKEDVLTQINEVLDSGQYIMGEKVAQVEERLARYINTAHAITVSDGSKAIMIALMALGIKPGDEVIVPDFTFFATASMAAILGAKIVFADIETTTYNLDPDKLEQLITKNTKAIIVVNLFGQCADMDLINRIAAKYDIPIVEDAAQSFGATYKGRHSGTLATIATTSFFPSKPLGCYGEGGACFTQDDHLAQKIKQIRLHGQVKHYHHDIIGVNGRFDTIQAAILLAKMNVFDKELTLRKNVAMRYDELLANAWCTTPKLRVQSDTHAYAQYTILVDNREKFIAGMTRANIPTAIHYPVPLHQQKALQSYYTGREDLTNSIKIAKQVVSLPMHPYLDIDSQDRVIAAVKTSL